MGGSGFPNFARFKMFLDERLTCFGLFWVHGIGFGYFRDESFLQLYSMVKGSSGGEVLLLWVHRRLWHIWHIVEGVSVPLSVAWARAVERESF